MKEQVARVLVCVAVVLHATRTRVAAQPAAGLNPLIRDLAEFDSVVGALEALAPALPQEALSPVSRVAQLLDVGRAAAQQAEDMLCTKPKVEQGRWVPSVLRGPQLSISLSAGNCTSALGVDGGLKKTSPILFVAKHTTPDVFEDGACKINKPVGAQAAPEERVLFQGGPDLRFESVDEFLRAIKAGAALFGPDVAAALTTPAPQVQQRAAPTAAQALAQPALQQKAAPVPAGVGLGSEFGGLEALLQSVGWQVVMKQTPADQAAAAPLAAPAGHA